MAAKAIGWMKNPPTNAKCTRDFWRFCFPLPGLGVTFQLHHSKYGKDAEAFGFISSI